MTTAMRRLPFKIVDVFTTTPYKGNPVAVLLDATGLGTDDMARIANWINLSETTFVTPATTAGADYSVRIFTPAAELPFAGHPTIGTAHALMEAGIIQPRNATLVQQCAAGLIHLNLTEVDGHQWLSFGLPEPKFEPLDDEQLAQLQATVGTRWDRHSPPCLVDVGARWVVVQLPNAKAVLDTVPDLARMAQQDRKGHRTGVVIFGPQEPGAASCIEVRAFAPAHGVNEDPVCGSGNGCVAAYIRHTGQVGEFGSDFLSSQGQIVGRAGTLRLSISDAGIQVAGNAVTCAEGFLNL